MASSSVTLILLGDSSQFLRRIIRITFLKLLPAFVSHLVPHYCSPAVDLGVTEHLTSGFVAHDSFLGVDVSTTFLVVSPSKLHVFLIV